MKRLTLSLASGIALVLALMAVGLSQGQAVMGDGLYDQDGEVMPLVATTGVWQPATANAAYYGGTAIQGNAAGGTDSYAFSFYGDSFSLWLARCSVCGIADVCIDESPPCSTSIDTYNPTFQYLHTVEFSGLDTGVHTVEIITVSVLTIIDAIYIECGGCYTMDETTITVEVTADITVEMTEEPYVQTWEIVDSEENAQIVAFEYKTDAGQIATIVLLFGIFLLLFTNTVFHTWRHINHDD